MRKYQNNSEPTKDKISLLIGVAAKTGGHKESAESVTRDTFLDKINCNVIMRRAGKSKMQQ